MDWIAFAKKFARETTFMKGNWRKSCVAATLSVITKRCNPYFCWHFFKRSIARSAPKKCETPI